MQPEKENEYKDCFSAFCSKSKRSRIFPELAIFLAKMQSIGPYFAMVI